MYVLWPYGSLGIPPGSPAWEMPIAWQRRWTKAQKERMSDFPKPIQVVIETGSAGFLGFLSIDSNGQLCPRSSILWGLVLYSAQQALLCSQASPVGFILVAAFSSQALGGEEPASLTKGILESHLPGPASPTDQGRHPPNSSGPPPTT